MSTVLGPRATRPSDSKIEETTFYNASEEPHPALIVPEILGLIAEHLQPDDFITMTQVCRTWRGCRDDRALVRALANERRLMPPPLYDFKPNRMSIQPSNLMDDILHERHMIRRLERKDISLGPKADHSNWTLSKTMRYVAFSRGNDNTTVHRLGPDGPAGAALMQLKAPTVLRWFGPKDGGLLRESRHGPISYFEMVNDKPECVSIAPYADFDYNQGILTVDSQCFLAACSDKNLRTFRRDDAGAFSLTSTYPLGRHKRARACSADGRTLALDYDEGGIETIEFLYDDAQENGGWRLLGDVQFDAYCFDVQVSPLGHFATVMGVLGMWAFSLNPMAAASQSAVISSSVNFGVLSPDELQYAQKDRNGVKFFSVARSS